MVSWPAANRLEAIFITSSTGGSGAVGEGGRGQPGHHVVAGLAPPVLDVAGELGVEVLERAVGHLQVVGVHELLEELRVVLLGHTEQVGDDQHGVGLGVLADELALAAGLEPVDLAVGQPPQGGLVLLQALRRDQPHQEPPLGGVLGGVEGGELVAEREAVAVGLDDLGDVIALERHGELGEGPDGRIAVRERGLVVVDLDRLVVARHHVDVVVRLFGHRAPVTQVLEVGVRVLDEILGQEEVDGIELLVAQWCSMVLEGGCPDRMGSKVGSHASAPRRPGYVRSPRRVPPERRGHRGRRHRRPEPQASRKEPGYEPGTVGEGRRRHGGCERYRSRHRRAVRAVGRRGRRRRRGCGGG